MFAFHKLKLQQYACISGFLTCFLLGIGKQKKLQRIPFKSDHKYNDFKGQTYCSKDFSTCILLTLEITGAVTSCWKVWRDKELQSRHGWNKQVLGWIHFILAKTPSTNAGCYQIVLDRSQHLWMFLPYVFAVCSHCLQVEPHNFDSSF